MQLTIKTAVAMRKLGGSLAHVCEPGTVIYLQGELGAGKTTFVRGFLRGLGYSRHVRSPTFNLFEIYQVKEQIICHFDLYRLKHPEELAYIGAADYFNGKNICLIEWPELGKGFLPGEDLLYGFDFLTKDKGRFVEILAGSSLGKKIVEKIAREIL